MPVTIALNHFKGKDGCKRLNCAQSVLTAFKASLNLDDDLVETFGSQGHGKADAQRCGALAAARELCANEEQQAAADRLFIEKGGSIHCPEIRKARRMSCSECVRTAVEFVMQNRPSDMFN